MQVNIAGKQVDLVGGPVLLREDADPSSESLVHWTVGSTTLDRHDLPDGDLPCDQLERAEDVLLSLACL